MLTGFRVLKLLIENDFRGHSDNILLGAVATERKIVGKNLRGFISVEDRLCLLTSAVILNPDCSKVSRVHNSSMESIAPVSSNFEDLFATK